jgi:uncharacterized membrane protein
MTGTTATADPVLEIFKEAKRAFRAKLKNPGLYNEILTVTTITDVYTATNKLQEERKGDLRGLAKIGRFLKCLESYAKVIEVFVQVKPDLLALIWGPIKLLLLWSSQLTAVMDKVTDALARIGQALPQFDIMAQTFESSDAIRAALALFYEDILEFYRIIFEFFQTRE